MLDEQRNNQEFSSIYMNFKIFLFDLVVPAKLQATSHYGEGIFNLDKHIGKHKFCI